MIAAAFQAGVVLRADACQQSELVAPQARHPSAPAVENADVFRSDQFSAGPQVFPEAACTHTTRVFPHSTVSLALAGPPSVGMSLTPVVTPRLLFERQQCLREARRQT